MPSWGDLLGSGSVAEQLLVWGLLNQLLGDFLGPALELVRQNINARSPVEVLSPAELADAVVRGIKDRQSATDEAARNGINPDRFTEMVQGAGEPPGLDTVLEMFRRGFIGWEDTGPDAPSVLRAIRTSRVYDYWSDAIRANADIPLSPGEAVDAYIRGQIDEPAAIAEAGFSGVNPDRFQVLADAAGRPPSLGELLELKRRRLIADRGLGATETTFQQGIAEGDTKNKWLDLYLALAEYIPPPRTVTTLLKTGAISTEQAQVLWQDSGITPEMSAAYAKSAQGEKLAGSRQLAEQTVLTLYETKAIDGQAAADHLGKLGYTAADVTFLLELADLTRELKLVNTAISRVGTLYTGHKIVRQAAADALTALGVTGDHAVHLLETWDLEAAANVRLLTHADITSAFEYGNMTEAEATAELVRLGYTPFDAWILLSNKAKGPLPARPAQGPPGPGVVS